MNEEEVLSLMSGSKSEAEWNANCDKVKKACDGYPDFWYGAIITSGVADRVAKSYGGSADIKISPVKERQNKTL